jgi:hypothetical protein
MTSELIPILAKAATEEKLLTQIYGDLAKPGVSQVGRALGTLLGLGNTILWPVQLLNERSRIVLEANLERCREKMSSIPEDNISPIPPEIGVPIVEKLSHVTDPDLRELYTNLLARASNADTQPQAHPSFVNVLNNISPDEALLIRQFKMQGGQIPFVSARLIDPTKNHWLQLVDVHFSLAPETKLAFSDNLPAYVSNLEGLGLIDIRRDIFVVPESVYDPLTNELTTRFQHIPQAGPFTTFRCERGKIEVTRFGWLFISACIS